MSMSKSRGSKIATETLEFDDALSLDDLDRVVGGSDSLPRREGESSEGGYHYEEGSTAAAATVHAPADLPPALAAIEAHVANDTWTGQQAVHEIATLIGQTDSSIHNIAGTEIATIIGRGEVTAQVAMTEIHNAVTGHTMTSEQAVGLLAGIITGTYATDGIDQSVGDAARSEINALIAGNHITVDHAITALAAAAGDLSVFLQNGLIGTISSLGSEHGLTPAQIADDIGAALNSGHTTGVEVISVLTFMASSSWDASIVAAYGTEIGQLLAEHKVSMADAWAGMQTISSAGWLGGTQAAEILAHVVNVDGNLAGAAGAEIGALLNPANVNDVNGTVNLLRNMVTTNVLTVDEAIVLWSGMAGAGHTATAASSIVSLYTANHLSVDQIVTDIHNAVVADTLESEAALAVLQALQSNPTYGSVFGPAVGAEIAALMASGEANPAQTLAPLATAAETAAQYLVYGDYYMYQFRNALNSLIAAAAVDAPGMDEALTAALQHLIATGNVSASTVVATMATQMGVGNNAGPVTEQVIALVNAHALTAEEAVAALAMGTNVSMAPVRHIADAIEALIDGGKISAGLAMNMIASTRFTISDYSAVNLMAIVAGQDPSFISAAASMIRATYTDSFTPASAIWAIHQAISLNGMPVDQGIALLTTMVGIGNLGTPALDVGAEIALLISQNKISPTQAMADLHAAVANRSLGADAAVVLLASAAIGASSATLMAINAELSALVSGGLLTAAQLAQDFQDLRTYESGNAALMAAVATLSGAAAAPDPATGIFSAINTSTNTTTLNTAADSLYAMITGGQTTVAHVMEAIDQALAANPPTMTNAQAMSLVIGIGGHSDLGVQNAAGAELAKLLAASGPLTNISWIDLQNTFGNAITANTITAAEAVGMLLGAIAAPGSTEMARSTARDTLANILTGSWGSTYMYLPSMPNGTLGTTITGMLDAGAISGEQALRTAFVMTGSRDYSANNVLVSLVESGKVSMTEVHTAITSGWWQIDAAVKTLAGISEQPAAMNELMSLLSGGNIPLSRMISDIHAVFNVSGDDAARVLGAIAATGTTEATSAVANEMIVVIKAGQISAAQVDALLDGAGSSRQAVVDNLLGQLGSYATNIGRADSIIMALVAAGATTFDHALAAVATTAGLAGVANVLNLFVIADGMSTSDANAVIVGMVGAGTISANQAITLYCKLGSTLNAGEGIAGLIANGNITAGSAVNAIVQSPDLTRISAQQLLATFASSTDLSVQNAVCDGIILLNYGSPTPDQTALTLLNLAKDNATWGAAIAGHLMYLVNSNQASPAMIDAMIGYAMGHGVPAANALPIIAQVGAQVQPADRAAFFNDITAMVSDGRVTAAEAIAALSAVSTTDPTLQQLIGAQIQAIMTVAGESDMLGSIGTSLTNHTMTGDQAAALLIGMTTSWNVPANVIQQIGTLVAGNLLTPAHVIHAVDNAIAAGTLTAAGGIAVLANCVGANASMNQPVGQEIGDLVAAGKISAQDAMFALNGTIGHPLTTDQWTGLMASMTNSGQYDSGALNTAISTNIANLIFANGLQTNDVVAGIRHAVVAGTVTADEAITLLAGLAAKGAAAPETEFRGAELHDAAIAALGQVASGALNSFNNVIASFGSDVAANMTLLTEIAAHAGAAFQAQYGSYIAQQVANGAMTPEQALAAISELNIDDTITPEQALRLYANMSAAVAIQPNASELNGPLNAAITALINNLQPDDDHLSGKQAVAILHELGANGGANLATVTGAQIDTLLGDPRTLIASAGMLGLDMNDAGAKLAAMINAGQIGAWEAVSNLYAPLIGQSMTGDQAVAFLLSVISHGTADGWAVNNGNPGQTNWQALASTAFAQFETYGVAPSVIMTGIHNSVTSFDLTGLQAGILLAGLIGHADLREAATAEMVRLLNDNGQVRMTAADAVTAISNTVSTGYANPGVLTPAMAVDVLVSIMPNATVLGDQGRVATALVNLPGMSPSQLVETVSGAIAAHAMTGQQALAILLPLATAGNGAVEGEVGNALAAMVQAGQLAVMDIRNSIRADVITPDTALVVLTGMIGLANGVMDVIADVRNTWGIDANRLMADLHGALADRTLAGDGVAAAQVMAVLATFPSSMATEVSLEVNSLISQGLMSYYGAVAALAEAAGEGTVDMQRAAAAVFARMTGSSGYDQTFWSTIAGLVPASMTADQAISVFAAISATPATGNVAINLDSIAREGIHNLIARSDIAARSAFADIAACLTSGLLTADQTVALMAGVATSATSSQTGGVLTAAAEAFNTLFASGQLNVAQTMSALDRGFMFQYLAPGEVQAAYDAAGLSSASAPALLAAIMATATNPAIADAASAELMALVNSHRLSAADAMSGIHGAVLGGLMSVHQALWALSNVDTGSNTEMQTAVAGEMAALLSANLVGVEDAVASLAAMANTSVVSQELAAGHAIALLVAQGAITIEQAVAGIRSALDANNLAPNNAIAALVGLSIGGSEELRDAAQAAIVGIALPHGVLIGNIFNSIIDIARQSDATAAAAAGTALAALVEAGVVSVTNALGWMHDASSSMQAGRFVAMLAGVAGEGGPALQVAAGAELAALTQRYAGMLPAGAFDGIRAAIADGSMSGADAVVMLSAAIPEASPYAQLSVAGQIAALVSGGQIDPAQAMTAIHEAVVAHAMTPLQAMTAMAFISQAGDYLLRQAVVAETENLVTSGQISATDALQALITVASGGAWGLMYGDGTIDHSVTLQSLTGGMIAVLIDHGHLTGAQVATAIADRAEWADSYGVFGNQHALALLMGISVGGGVDAQEAAGATLASMVQANRAFTGDILTMIDSSVVSHTISAAKAITLLMNFSAAMPDPVGYQNPVYLTVGAEVRSLVDRGLITANQAFGPLFAVAVNNPAAAMSVGVSIGLIWTNDNSRVHADYVGSNDIKAAIENSLRNGDMTAAETITLVMGIGLNGRVVEAGHELAQLIGLNLVTAEQVVGTLAQLSIGATSLELAAIGKELAAAMPADQAATLVGNLIETQALSASQGIMLLSSLAAGGNLTTQMAAGNELASLIQQGTVDATQAMNIITSAVQQNAITTVQAVTMLTGAVVGGSVEVQTAASSEIAQLIAFNRISAADAMATIRAAVTDHAITIDEALAAQANLAAVTIAGGASLLSAFATEVAVQIAGNLITADRAIAVLAEAAGDGSRALQAVVGQEIGALIAGGQITAARAMTDIHGAVTSNALTAGQAIVVLAGIAATAGSGAQVAVAGEINALIANGLIAVDQALGDLFSAIQPAASYGPTAVSAAQVLGLAVAMGNVSTDLRNTVAAAMAHGIMDGRFSYGDVHYALQNALGGHVITPDQQLALMAAIGANADANLQNTISANLRGLLYTTVQADRLHALEVLAGVAGSGDAPYQVYIGQELARLSTLQTFMPAADINTAIRAAISHQTISGVEAVNLFAALFGATSGAVHAAALSFIVQLVTSSMVSGAAAIDAFGRGDDIGAMTADQIFEGLFTLYQIGARAQIADDITHEIVDLVAAHKTTLAAVTERVQKAVHDGTMTSDAAIEFLSGLAWVVEPAARPQIAEAAAELMLKDWGITVDNPMYTDLLNGAKEVTLQVAQLGQGLTVQQVINNITQYAEARAIPVDMLLIVLMHESKGVAQLLPAAAALAPMIATVVNDHLQAGTTQQHLAAQIVNGRFSADVGEALLTAMATDLWSMTQHTASTDLLLQAATDILHVEVAVQTVAPQVLSGQMTGVAALELLISKVGNTPYALDIGLQHLALLTATLPGIPADYLHPELSGATPAEIRAAEQAVARAEIAQGQILQYIADRALWGGMAASMIDAMNSGLISVGDAIAFTQATCSAGRAGSETGALVDDIGLVRLLQAAPPSSGLAYSLHHNDALVLQMTTGISALMLLDAENLAQNMATAQTLFQDHIYNTVGWPVPGAPYTPDPAKVEEEGEKSLEWYEKAWNAMREASGTVDTFGTATSLTMNAVSRFSTGDLITIGAATAIGGVVGFPLAGPVVLGAALGHDTLEGYVRFGATLATQGIPGVSAIAGMPTLQGMFINEAVNTMAGEAVTVGVEVPGWAMEAMGNYAPEFLDDTATVNLSPAAVFTAVSITSAVLPKLLMIGAVSETLAGGSEMLSGACGVVSATCQLITGTITGTVVTAGVTAFNAFTDMTATFRDIGGVIGGVTSVDSLSHSAQSLGENLFAVMYAGMDVNAVIDAGVDTGQFMVSLFSGNTSALAGDAQAMGESLFNLVTSNRYVQMFTDKVLNFADTVQEAADLYVQGMGMLAHSDFGEAIWDGWTSLF